MVFSGFLNFIKVLFSWKKFLKWNNFLLKFSLQSFFSTFFLLSLLRNYLSLPTFWYTFRLGSPSTPFWPVLKKSEGLTNCLPDFHTFLWPWFLGHSKCIFQVGHKIELSNFVIGWGTWLDTRFNASLHSLEHVYFGNWSNYQSSVSTMSCLVRFKRDSK